MNKNLKNFVTLIALFLLIGIFYGCEPAGKKAAKEGMECLESAVDNATSITSAQQAMKDCQEKLKAKYQDKINNDPAFAKDFLETGNANKDFEKKLEDKLQSKFGPK